MKALNLTLAVIALVLGGFSLFHASWLAGQPQGRLDLVAKGGIYQKPGEIDADTPCPSARIAPLQPHNFIANSVVGINYARSRRASFVEVMVRPTADGRLVLFGDATLDCRTDGTGRVSDHTLEELEQLDIGHGLTHDGENFALRGRGVGLMPSIATMLVQAGDGGIIYHFAEDDPEQADMLAAEYALAGMEMRDDVIVIGAPTLLERIAERFPQADILDVPAAEACYDRYIRIGWLGRVPEECSGGFISIPITRQWMIWGWPNRFNARMRAANIRPMIVRANDGDAVPTPLETFDEIADVPQDFRGLLWLADIDTMGPSIRS
ncbi:MAG: glycerophosphodiester phosphodiesterase family protein [Pseudomonadota bacterium]